MTAAEAFPGRILGIDPGLNTTGKDSKDTKDAKDEEAAAGRDSRSRLRFWRRDEGDGDEGEGTDK